MPFILGGVECDAIVLDTVECTELHLESVEVFASIKMFTVTVPAQAGTGTWTARYGGAAYASVTMSSATTFNIMLPGNAVVGLLDVKYDRAAYFQAGTQNVLKWVNLSETPLGISRQPLSSLSWIPFVVGYNSGNTKYLRGPGITQGVLYLTQVRSDYNGLGIQAYCNSIQKSYQFLGAVVPIRGNGYPFVNNITENNSSNICVKIIVSEATSTLVDPAPASVSPSSITPV